MFRWLAALLAALYIGMVLGGEDRGQTRAGLQGDVSAPQPVQPLATAHATPVEPEPTLVVMPAPVLASLPVVDSPVETEVDPNLDLRWVTANRANVRLEPNKNSPVTGKVTKGESLLVLWAEPNGWIRVRMEGDGVDGYIHQNLLTDQDPLANAAQN